MLKRGDEQYQYHNFEELKAAVSELPREVLVKRLEEAIIACREWEDINDCSLDGIFVSDGEGNALYANEAYYKISGLKWEEIDGKNLRDFENLKFISTSVTLTTMKLQCPVTQESYFYRTGIKGMVTCNPIFKKDGSGEISVIVSNVRNMVEIERLKKQITKEQEMASGYREDLEIIRKQLFGNQKIIAQDPLTLETLRVAQRIAATDATALLTGETGVGKEIFSQYIHDNSSRRNANFIKVNSSAFTRELLESELFGYEKGAFTGANREGKKGLFEVADHGTLFLDEIGELPLDLQAKLLRVLQEGEMTRVGGVKPIKVDVRVIAATNRNLEQMVEEGTFRADLYYRLSVVPLKIPPLRERKEDIVPLATHFCEKLNRKYGYKKYLSEGSIQAMLAYSWPGNIRELRNVIERACIMCRDDELWLSDLQAPLVEKSAEKEGNINLSMELKRLEFGYMKRAYQKFGNCREAADSLGMKKSTYAGKYQEYRKLFQVGGVNGTEAGV